MNQSLVYVEQAYRALEQARSINDVRDVRDKAESIRSYMKLQGYGREILNAASELKLRAERRLGELLRETVQHGGDRKSKLHRTTLNGLPEGVSRDQSHRWQLAAEVPADAFESYIAKTKDAGQPITSAAVLRMAKTFRRNRESGRELDIARLGCSVEQLEHLIQSDMRFGTIYADPPWRYENQGTRASTDSHYSTMTVDEICALPVEKLVADSAHLHIWTTNAFLFETKRVIESWGFTYKSCMVWVKPQMGIGNYWRVSHEFMLLGVRGSCPFLSHDTRSWLEVKRLGHSQKPSDFRIAIERVSPGPRLEMFARSTFPGWVSWGNQIDHGMFQNSIEGAYR